MSILDRLGRRGAHLPHNATYRLTSEGREKLMTYTGNPQSRVLVALETNGSSSDIDEIAGSAGLSKGQVERLLLTLLQKGYVQRVGAFGGGGSSGPEEGGE